MRSSVVTYLPWMISALTILMVHMTGNKHPKTWLLGLFNQGLWSAWILCSYSWGLVPLNVVLWYMYFKNHKKWKAEAAK